MILLLQDIRGVHIRFIDECFERLEDLTNQNAGGSPARTTSGHITDPEVKLQAIERLLILAQRYISTVEVHTYISMVEVIYMYIMMGWGDMYM